jgi:5-methylcytosine-specific restriction protein B
MSRKEEFTNWLRTKVDTDAPISSYPTALEIFIPERLYELNVNTQSRVPSAAIGKYIEFLEGNLSSNFDDVNTEVYMLNLDGFHEYLKKKGYAKKTIRNNIAYLKRSLNILNKIDWFIGTDEENIIKFSIQGNDFKYEFDKYHEYNPINDSTFSNFRESAKKYKSFLNRQNIQNNNEHHIAKTKLNIKNIILYGSPGVGKTHNYKNLISMIEEGNKTEKEIFDTIKKNDPVSLENDIFETIKNEKRVEFVTFHQSYSYEDFIEGFRPSESGNIKLEDGIFKLISNKAEENLKNSKKEIYELKREKNLFQRFKQYVNNKIENNEKISLQRGEEFYLIKFEDNKLFFTASNKSNSTQEFSLKYNDFISIYGSFVAKRTLQDISTILGTNSIQQKYAYYLQIYHDFESKHYSILSGEEKFICKGQNFYLVIDEINRGNISKFFCELITLIEEEKRYDGKRADYEVSLPYSKEKFKIPSNLFIIATMNSTDKSIATIDIALRKRFVFLKMNPNEGLVQYPDAKKLMNDLNKFIGDKNILGEDYKLGHSYFMKVENNEDLEFVKEYKIKPLLEEYFYADSENFDKIIKILEGKQNV